MSLTKVRYSMIDKTSINVRDFGAVGDGTTNDAPAIQSAITAAGDAGGGVVYFPPGTYRVNTLYSQHTNTNPDVPNPNRQYLVIDQDNVRLSGDGATIFCNKNTGGFRQNMIMVFNCKNTTIENLIFDNNGLTLSESRTQAIVTQGLSAVSKCEDVIIRNCRLQNSTYGIFIYRRSEHVRIDSCFIDTGFGINVGGDDTDGSADGIIGNLVIENNTIKDVLSEAVDFNHDVRNFKLINNFMINSNTEATSAAVYEAIDVGGDQALEYGLIEGNTIFLSNDFVSGIRIKQDTINLKISNNRIRNLSSSPNDSHGIRISDGVECSIIGNHINGFSHGIRSAAIASDNPKAIVTNNIIKGFHNNGISIASDDCKIQNNLIDGTANTATGKGIFAGGSKNNEITGNTVVCDSGQSYGIQLSSCTNVTLNNNTVQSSETGIYVLNSTNVSVSGNAIDDSENESLIVEDESNISITGNVMKNGNLTGGTRSVEIINVTNCVFSGNLLRDTNAAGQTMKGSVNADANCDYIIFTSNSAENCTSASFGINGAVSNSASDNNLT